ncbi:MAG: hypothetical protein Q8L49_07340 [Burkholderiaceae bacterium]|nr:hypothetical protein [Burkholderiaceae bacterium]
MSEAPENAQPPAQFNPRSNRRTAEEDRAWAQLYASVGQASTAEEVVKQLDADAEARRSHLALYLRAKTTLRERRVADARNQRVGAFVRTFVESVVAIVVVGPLHMFRLLRSLLSTGSAVAVEMLPPARRDPAKVRVSALTRDPEFAKAAERFTATADGATPIAGQHEESRGAKAA